MATETSTNIASTGTIPIDGVAITVAPTALGVGQSLRQSIVQGDPVAPGNFAVIDSNGRTSARSFMATTRILLNNASVLTITSRVAVPVRVFDIHYAFTGNSGGGATVTLYDEAGAPAGSSADMRIFLPGGMASGTTVSFPGGIPFTSGIASIIGAALPGTGNLVITYDLM